jgi:methyl-accepting chemotaxis protein
MRMFRNLSVRVKIMIPVILLAVIIVSSSLVDFASMKKLNQASTEISDNYAYSLNMVGNIDSAFQELKGYAFAHIVADTSAETERVSTNITRVYNEILELMEEFESGLDEGSDEETYYYQFKDKCEEFQEVYQQLIALRTHRQQSLPTELSQTSQRKWTHTSKSLRIMSLRQWTMPLQRIRVHLKQPREQAL